MREQLVKAMKNRLTVCIMYMSKDQSITKRHVKILNISGDSFSAYCYTRQAKRTFLIENVLAVAPVKTYERKVI